MGTVTPVSNATLTETQRKAIDDLEQAHAEMVVRGRTILESDEEITGAVCAIGALWVVPRSSPLASRALEYAAKQHEHIRFAWGCMEDEIGLNDRIYNDVYDEGDNEVILSLYDEAAAYIRIGKVS